MVNQLADPNKKRTQVIQYKVSKEEFSSIKERADREDSSMSAYSRNIILNFDFKPIVYDKAHFAVGQLLGTISTRMQTLSQLIDARISQLPGSAIYRYDNVLEILSGIRTLHREAHAMLEQARAMNA